VRISAVIVLVLAIAGCGGTQSSSSFGDVALVLGDAPIADEAGIFLATQRGYDTAEGVTLQLEREGRADFRLVSRAPAGCVAVLAIVRPDKLVLCADEITLQDERDKVLAVARALARGYTQAQLEPAEAVNAMTERLPELDRAELSAQLDEALPTWTAGAKYFGELAPGPNRDPSVAREAAAR
jgi:ABC-type nitrate/sulfonate/bicarbonate transport system substrate-binding protein